MSTYRFSWMRPNGWSRLGAAGAVCVMFATPMLWALGSFGVGDDTLRRALIFMFAGMWMFVGGGYAIGWAIRGFLIRVKDADEDEDGGARRSPPPPHAPPAGAAHRPGH